MAFMVQNRKNLRILRHFPKSGKMTEWPQLGSRLSTAMGKLETKFAATFGPRWAALGDEFRAAQFPQTR